MSRLRLAKAPVGRRVRFSPAPRPRGVRPTPDLTLCVQRFDDAGFARDLEATCRALVAAGYEVWTEDLGEHGALLLCYVDRERRRPLEPDVASEATSIARAAVRRAIRTLCALRRASRETLCEAAALACAVAAAVDKARAVADADLAAAFGELLRIRRSFVRGRVHRHVALVEGVIGALATRGDRRPE